MNIAINGFGRIGRAVFKIAIDRGFNVVAVNDIHGAEDAEYMLKYDSVYGKYKRAFSVEKDRLIFGSRKIKVLSELDPEKLPWKEMNVDLVVESTGVFSSRVDAGKHLVAGAKYVVITAPCKDEPDLTIVPGVNHKNLNGKQKIISVASCTTNCVSPVLKVLNDFFEIERAMFTTVHAYTATQALVDGFDKSRRRGRAAALNIIPTTTGASDAVTSVLPELQGKLSGLAMRVPIAVGSVSDVVALVKKKTDSDEVNKVFRKVSDGQMKGIIEFTMDEIVSSDVIGNPNSAIVDSLATQVEGRLVKVIAWYDNEFGYSNRVADVVEMIRKAKRR